MTGHFEGAQAVAFSPDGTRLATASTLSGLVWDAGTGKLVASFNGHSDVVTSVAFSPDGTLVVSAAVDDTARVWEADTGREAVVLAEHRETDTDAAFVPDGTLIVTGARNGDVRVWDAVTGAPRARFECDDRINGLAVSPDGAVVAVTTTIRARAWELATGIPDLAIDGGHDYLNAVAFGPPGRCSASRPPTRRRPSGMSRPAFRWRPWRGTPVPWRRSRSPRSPRPARSRSRPGRWTAPPGPGTRLRGGPASSWPGTHRGSRRSPTRPRGR